MNYHQNYCNSLLIPYFYPCPHPTPPNKTFKHVNQIMSVTVLHNTFLTLCSQSERKRQSLPWLLKPSKVCLTPLSLPQHILITLSLVLFLPHWHSHCSFKQPVVVLPPHGFALAVLTSGLLISPPQRRLSPAILSTIAQDPPIIPSPQHLVLPLNFFFS